MAEVPGSRYALRRRNRVSQGSQDDSDIRGRPIVRRRTSSTPRELCPVCDNFISGSRSQIIRHINSCLIAPSSIEREGASNFDEYEWAGQRRVRSSFFLERGDYSGFTSITHGNEDEVLDIENELLHKIGPSQYTTADIIFPQAETAKEQFERDSLLVALGHKKEMEESSSRSDCSPMREEESLHETDSSEENASDQDSLQKQIQFLKHQNEELRRKTICKICMDTYEKPLVSLECWHAHCEQCWLRSLGVKKLCPQCKVITNPEDLRKIFL